MPPLRTSPIRLAAAIIGTAMALPSGPAFAQDIPVVQPRSEIFGATSTESTTSAPRRAPFSVLDPDWQSIDSAEPQPVRPVRLERRPAEFQAFTASPVEPASNIVPVPAAPPLPEIDLPVIDTTAAKLMSPVREATALPVLQAPDSSESTDPPTYAPKPAVAKPAVAKPESTSEASATADDLEGMLHSMVWVTGTIGLGAVLSLWMFRLWLTRGGRTMLPTKSLKLVDTLRIGPRCGVYLVEAESHRVLVGVEHGKTMCLMPLPANFNESLHVAGDEIEDLEHGSGFDRVADVFSARRESEDRAKGASS